MKRPTIAALACLALAGVWTPAPAPAGEAEVEVVHPWIRVVVPGRPAAGYLGIHNTGEVTDRLTGARAASAEAVELHISEGDGGTMTMRPLDAVEIPAGGMAELAPGGAHLMLFGLDGLGEGDVLPVTLVFERAGEVVADFTVSRRMPEHGHDGHPMHGEHHGHGSAEGTE